MSGNMERRDGDEQTAGYDRPDQAEAGLSETGGVLTSVATQRKTIVYYYISEPADFLEGSEPGSPPPEPAAAASPAQAGPSSAAAVPTEKWAIKVSLTRSASLEELLAATRPKPGSGSSPVATTSLTAAEREVPPLMEVLRNGPPVNCGGHSHKLPHQAVPDGSDHVGDDAADCGDTNPEAAGDGPE
ncbi:hypothetical protein DPX16_3510 [Anabarilius grahami]|uniref:Uncharacterized protein n=1 Tax=Anabarilius grahami TaxID=495550 RepID=A0A3N0Y6Q4_ANAGA|nr:hypothetical protein DPX16_3510 [Anabarilius grahami]